jgi:hypothetical protein
MNGPGGVLDAIVITTVALAVPAWGVAMYCLGQSWRYGRAARSAPLLEVREARETARKWTVRFFLAAAIYATICIAGILIASAAVTM